MLKHKLFALTLCAALGAGSYTVFAQDAQPVVTEEVASLPDGQEELAGDWANSAETNTVEESEIARKMTQAEKAQNAAENDGYGFAITIIAMCIVLAALVVLCILFQLFGKISTGVLARKKHEVTGNPDNNPDNHEALDSGETIAAIAAALAEHFGQGHDIEDTILTIRRMKRAYSPWNSKIYNIRQAPELHRNVR
ncbi:MAG: OadG family protein [Muribaculaceae bacterium]|nr:OadG family protein [Muribaculaceae bacterium]